MNSQDIVKPNNEIIDVVGTFSKDKHKSVWESILWIKKNFKFVRYDEKLFRKRSASQIFSSKISTGCTDTALVFLSFMKALGIHATYLEAISECSFVDYFKYPAEEMPLRGHVFVKVVIDGLSFIVDPTMAQILLGENLPSQSMFSDSFKIAEGDDFISLNLNTEEKIKSKMIDYINRKVLEK